MQFKVLGFFSRRQIMIDRVRNKSPPIKPATNTTSTIIIRLRSSPKCSTSAISFTCSDKLTTTLYVTLTKQNPSRRKGLQALLYFYSGRRLSSTLVGSATTACWGASSFFFAGASSAIISRAPSLNSRNVLPTARPVQEACSVRTRAAPK